MIKFEHSVFALPFALTAALLVFLMVWWATHDGKTHHAATTAPAKAAPTVEIVK